MKVYGLTGGIASGKSTVARVLRELGATVVDADELAREVVRPGQPAHAEIKARWPQVIGKDGALDRARLGEIVFSDPEARAALNAMTHPRIAEASAARIEAAAGRGERLAFYEAALLVENKVDEALDGLWVVSLPEDVQLARVMARDGLSEAAARARIAAQLPLATKVARATHVIDNAGPPERTRAAVEALYRALVREAEAG
jgi:dephospho-CoA kinase